MENPIVKSSACKTFHTKETKKNSMMNDVNFIQGTRLYLSSKPPVAFGDIESFPSEHDFSVPYVNTPLDVNASCNHEYTGDNAVRRGDVQFTGKLTETSLIEDTDRFKDSIRDNLPEINVDNHFKVIKQLTQQCDFMQKMRSESDRNDAKICLPALKTSGENKDSLGVHLVSEGIEEELHQHQEFLSVESPADTDESDTVLDNSSAIHSSGSLKKNICNNSIIRKGRNVAFGSSSAVSTGVGSVGSFQSNNDEAAQLCSGSVEVIPIQQYQQNNVPKAAMGRGCIYNTSNEMLVEKEKISIGTDLRRVRFSGEDIWSYYCGPVQFPSINSPAVASCDPSLCYSLSMASLEATAGGPTNIASDIYSRWGVAPLPDGCSYECSWSQALLQSIPLFSRCGKNQSPLSTCNQIMGDMTISTLAGLSPSAKYYGRSPPKPGLFNNMLYLCRNSRCSAPVTPHNSSLSTVPAKGCSTTTNAACRKRDSLDDLSAAMSAAVAQIESHECKHSKEKSNIFSLTKKLNEEDKSNRPKSPTILPDTVLHKLPSRQTCLSQNQQLSTKSNHAAIYNKKKHTHHPVIDKINNEFSKSLIKHDFISKAGSQVNVSNSEISYAPRAYVEQNCPSGTSTMLKIVLPILKRSTGLSRYPRGMSNASPTSSTNSKSKVMIGLWGTSNLIGKLSRNNSGSSNSDVSGSTSLSGNGSYSAISKAWHGSLRPPHQHNTSISNKSHDETSAVTQGKGQDFMLLNQSGVSSCSNFRDSLDMHCMLKSLKNEKGCWKDGHLCVTSSDDTVLEKPKYNEISEVETQNNNSGKSDDSPSPSASCRSCWGSRRHRKSSRCSQFSARVSTGLSFSVLKRTCSEKYTSAQTQAHTPTAAVGSGNTRPTNSCVALLQKEICDPALALARKQKCSYTAGGTVMPTNLQYCCAGRVQKLTKDNNKENLGFIPASCSNAALPYDLEFGNLKVKLHKKLSAKCHCQFDVWEAEVTEITDSEKVVAVESNIRETINEDLATKLSGMLDMSNIEKLKVGSRFALKLLEIDSCETSKLKYKTYSILAEGRQLKNLYGQMHERDTDNQKKSSLMVIPIPNYYWTGSGYRKSAGTKVLGVAMELIQGRSLTQILQQLRCPIKQSVALLAIEIALKIVQSQQVLVGGLAQPLINWDTKPGNILLELIRSTSGRLHCRRAVIIDLGDALLGPEYWFPTRHRPGETPGYIICTKGYCSPECAVLVFLLASSSRCGSFRKVWYGENAQIERLQEARKQRLPYRWRQWVKEGFLRRTCMSNNVTSLQRSTNISGRCSSSFYPDNVDIEGCNTHNSSQHQAGRIDGLATRQRSCSSSNLFHGTSLMNGYAKNELSAGRNSDKGDHNKVTFNVGGAKQPKNKVRGGSDDAAKWFQNNINKINMKEKHEQQQENHNGRGDRGYWEVNFTEKSVVFSTGLVLAQLFGGPNLLQVVEKDEVRALDLLCEWGFCDSVNYYSGRMNLGPKHLLPSAGVFSEEPWRSKVLTLLENCLAFVPSKRWTFCEIHVYLLKLYEDYITAYNANKRSGIVNAIHQATTFRVKKT